MDRKKQREFIRNYLKDMREHINGKIKDLPDDWDGIELRQWVSDKFAQETYAWTRQSQYRRKKYERQVYDRNL